MDVDSASASAPIASTSASATTSTASIDPTTSISVPEGLRLHTENTTHLLLSANEAFLNPVQEFNRDLSVACIRVWSEMREQERQAKREAGRARKKAKVAKEGTSTKGTMDGEVGKETGETSQPAPLKATILEALSATGLRAIRYAKEIPLASRVIANDLSPAAAEAIRRNVSINGPLAQERVHVNQGDACALLYNHRSSPVDVVDLDPYGTAAPFVDGAVQAIRDGGLLCVTCTDLAVLATVNYPEKCYSNYGGVSVKADYCHEAALRLVLHSLATAAARYGRAIEPLLSLSIDFYVRVFVRVRYSAIGVKRLIGNTSTYYVCSFCQAHYGQTLGRVEEKTHQPSGNVNVSARVAQGPPVDGRCPECESKLHLAGPMWSGPLHDKFFVKEVLKHVEGSEEATPEAADAMRSTSAEGTEAAHAPAKATGVTTNSAAEAGDGDFKPKYGTAARMKGMLTVTSEELDIPFFFTPSRIAGTFHCITPSLDDITSAILHAGHAVSRSHAAAGSLKTTASMRDLHDIFRAWISTHPVNREKIAMGSPTVKLLDKEGSFQANFKRHPDLASASSKVKLVRYQVNPTAGWGPGTKAGGKRKRGKEEKGEQ